MIKTIKDPLKPKKKKQSPLNVKKKKKDKMKMMMIGLRVALKNVPPR
jgi:hypothetical protein